MKKGHPSGWPFFIVRTSELESGADDRARRIVAGLGRLRVRSRRAPRLRRASHYCSRDRHVLRRREAVQRRRTRRGTGEVRTVVVGSVLLFVGRQVAKVRLHRGDISLVLRICKLRNRDRGKDADDDDHDQKLNEGKALFVILHMNKWLPVRGTRLLPNVTPASMTAL